MNMHAEIMPLKTGATNPALSLSAIQKSYGAVRALKGVDLELRSGEIHAIVGENGAGKSTLIGVAAGVVVPNAGTVCVNGKQIGATGNPLDMRNLGIAVVYQHPALAPDLTILENLRLGQRSDAALLSPSKAREIIDGIAVDGSRLDLGKRVQELNLAQMHIVEIARALVCEPAVIIFDEPTEPFQQADVKKLFRVIRDLKARNVAIAYISHRLHEVMEIADRVSVLRDGEMVGTHDARDLDIDRVITLVAGRPLEQVFPPKATMFGDVRLSTQNLSGGRFQDVSLAVRAGEVLGVAGVEGQGQREFLRSLAGLEGLGNGSVTIDGEKRDTTSPLAAKHAGISFLSDDRHGEGLFLSLPIRENIALRVLDRLSTAGIMRRGADGKAAHAATERLHVKAPSMMTKVSSLSGGNQQKVLFARETFLGAKIYLIDEPTKGVDIGSRSEIYAQIRDLASEGAAVVVLSSDGVELEGLCDRVLVFARGQVVTELQGADVNDDQITGASLTAKVLRTEQAEVADRARARFLSGDYFPLVILGCMIALVVGLTSAGNPYFVSPSNIVNMLVLSAVLALLSSAQLLPILTGGIDLSVGPLAGFSLVLASYLLGPDISTTALLASIVGIILIGTAFGLLQGALVSLAGLPAIVVTLVSFIGLQGVSLVLRPQPTGDISELLGESAAASLFDLVPAAMILAVAIIMALEVLLFRTMRGRKLRAVGSDSHSAFRLGVIHWRSQMLAFGLAGTLSATAGLILAGQIGIGSATVGTDYTLLSVTVVVLSGASITGGRGSFVCVLFGALLVQLLSSASSFVEIDPAWQYVVVGAIAIAAASLFGLSRQSSGQGAANH